MYFIYIIEQKRINQMLHQNAEQNNIAFQQ
jgi:hypothetical protein